MKRIILPLLLVAAAPHPQWTLDKQIDVLAAMLDPAEVEDDNGPDAEMRNVETKGCTTGIETKAREYSIDWTKPAQVVLGDTFVFIEAPPVKLAIVGDASRPRQAEVLKSLARAMNELAAKCAAPSAGN